jgi:hypothetical protein
MTMFGLILFLISVTYPPWLVHTTTLAIYEARRDHEILKMEVAEANKQEEKLNQELDRQRRERPLVESQFADLERRAGDGSHLSRSQ